MFAFGGLGFVDSEMYFSPGEDSKAREIQLWMNGCQEYKIKGRGENHVGGTNEAKTIKDKCLH